MAGYRGLIMKGILLLIIILLLVIWEGFRRTWVYAFMAGIAAVTATPELIMFTTAIWLGAQMHAMSQIIQGK
jgi:hypothetical protein